MANTGEKNPLDMSGCWQRSNNPEYMRLDVIFEGALDLTENFDEESVWEEWNQQLSDLEENCFDEYWSLSVYDEREYPPRLVTEHINDPEEDNEDE